MTRPVLLVEDDASIAVVIRAALEAEGHTVEACDSIAVRDRMLAGKPYSVMLTDVMLTDGDGIETLGAARALQPDLQVIILSAQNTLDTAVRASDTGAFEYFPKPFDLDELVRTVSQAVQNSGADSGDPGTDAASLAMPLVGRGPAMQAVFRMITRVLRNDLTVLILGESGTGKELVAEAIHTLGDRASGPFVAVNAAAIPSELIESELFGHEKGAFTGAVARSIGKFEQAQGGTLFLDEIGDMPMQAQTRLLRTLQSGSVRRVGGREEIAVNARIVAATNRDLVPMIAAGAFREDLYYRLNVVPIELPPLRERSEDIEALARHFLAMAAQEGLPRRGLSDGAATLLKRHYWRGNVRELKNLVYRAALLAREENIDAAVIAPLIDSAPLPGEEAEALSAASFESVLTRWLEDESPMEGDIHAAAIAAIERPLLATALARTNGNQLRAAQWLGINRNTLRKRLTDLEIVAEDYSDPFER